MKRNVAFFVLTILAFTLFLPDHSLASPNISSPKAVLIDGKTGQVLYSKNADEKAYPASTTKIMTAVLALERGNLEDYVPISRKASFIDGSRIYLLEGEKITLEQLLYGLMLDSANDAAIAIAEHIGGSIEEFAVMMNDKARELGALNTNFTNPNGLPDPNHVTTAYDMAMIAKHAMSIPKFREIAGTVSYIIPETNMQDTRYLYNGNKLIKNTPYKYDGATGIKTGYTLAAKQCFIGSAERDGMELITVILNENNANAVWENTMVLLDYGFDNFVPISLVKKNQVIDEIEVKGSIKKVVLVSERDFHYDAPEGETPEIDEKIVLNDRIVPPIHKGERLGYIEYSIDGETIGTVRLVAGEVAEDPVKASGVIVGGKSKTGSIILWTFFLLLLGGSILTLRRKRRRRKNMYSYRNNIFRKK